MTLTPSDIWKEDLFCQCGRIGRVEIAQKVADELEEIETLVDNVSEEKRLIGRMKIALLQQTLRGSSQEGKR